MYSEQELTDNATNSFLLLLSLFNTNLDVTAKKSWAQLHKASLRLHLTAQENRGLKCLQETNALLLLLEQGSTFPLRSEDHG